MLAKELLILQVFYTLGGSDARLGGDGCEAFHAVSVVRIIA